MSQKENGLFFLNKRQHKNMDIKLARYHLDVIKSTKAKVRA
jgi:hypothetical protein